jgi:hypothetical protein
VRESIKIAQTPLGHSDLLTVLNVAIRYVLSILNLAANETAFSIRPPLMGGLSDIFCGFINLEGVSSKMVGPKYG